MSDDRKQYASKVVVNIIRFMAQAGVGIQPSQEEIDMIPEEFYREIMASLMTSRAVKKLQTLAAMSQAFPPEDILEKAKKEAEKD